MEVSELRVGTKVLMGGTVFEIRWIGKFTKARSANGKFSAGRRAVLASEWHGYEEFFFVSGTPVEVVS